MATSKVKTDFELNWIPSLAFELIPRLNIQFDPPVLSTVNALKNATTPVVELPISGKCPGIGDGLKCSVTWKIKTGDEINDCSTVSAKFKKVSDGVFKIVDEQNNNLKVDIFKNKITGKGTFGYSIKPDMPYHDPVENFPSEFTFNHVLDIMIPSVSSAKIGQKVDLNIITTGIFNHTDVRILIVENDDGEVANQNAVGVQHTWRRGDRESWIWAIGFGDDGYGLLTYPEPNESGGYEYNFTLMARCSEKDEFVEIVKKESILKNILKPELTEFKLEYRKDTFVSTLVAKGVIKNFGPETKLEVGVNLLPSKLPDSQSPASLNEKTCKSFIDKDGNFEIPIEWVFWEKNKRNLSDFMAMLYLPQLGNENLHSSQHCAPVSWVIDYDDSKFASFDGSAFVGKDTGKWVCSKEGGYGSNSAYDFVKELTRFPESYHAKLKVLHEQHPKWQFIAKLCNFDFNEFVDKEMKHGNVCTSLDKYGYAPKKTGPEKYDPGWHGASKSAVKYFIDPRNHLDSKSVFQFLSAQYDAFTQLGSYVKPILGGKLAGKENVFIEAGGNKINAVFLSAKAMVESGGGASSLATGTVNGYNGYYNMYGIGATDGSATVGGAKKAKENGWDSVDKAIIGGAEWIYNNYVKNASQDTAYTLKWNIALYEQKKIVGHQYATSIFDARVKGSKFGQTLSNLDVPFVFSIPVFNNMPESCSEPTSAESLN